MQSFRGKRQDAVNAILKKNDCIVLMPTGGGKTACCAVPGIILPGLIIIVTPMIALTFHQVQRLRSVGLSVCYLVMKNNRKMQLKYLTYYNKISFVAVTCD